MIPYKILDYLFSFCEICSHSNTIGILLGIVLNPWITLDSADTFTMLILPIYE